MIRTKSMLLLISLSMTAALQAGVGSSKQNKEEAWKIERDSAPRVRASRSAVSFGQQDSRRFNDQADFSADLDGVFDGDFDGDNDENVSEGEERPKSKGWFDGWFGGSKKEDRESFMTDSDHRGMQQAQRNERLTQVSGPRNGAQVRVVDENEEGKKGRVGKKAVIVTVIGAPVVAALAAAGYKFGPEVLKRVRSKLAAREAARLAAAQATSSPAVAVAASAITEFDVAVAEATGAALATPVTITPVVVAQATAPVEVAVAAAASTASAPHATDATLEEVLVD